LRKSRFLAGIAGVALTITSSAVSASGGSALPVDPACFYKGCWSTTQSAPWSSHYTEFYGASCSSEEFCIAVGRFDPSWNYRFKAYAEQWNGKTWSIMSVPSPGAANDFNELAGVSCVSETFCMAVGRFGPNKTHVIAARWDGSSWALLPAPNPGGIDGSSALHSISCVSDSFCVAAGSYACTGIACPPSLGTFQPLVERWDGSSWSVMTLPAGDNYGSQWLTSVSCASPAFCMAVGERQSSALDTFAVNWDGSSWTTVTTMNPGQTAGYTFDAVTGVSCTSPDFCMAVGVFGSFDQNRFQTAAQRWDGTGWTVTSTADPSTASSGYEGLTGVSCVTPDFCVSSGLFGPSPTPIGPYPYRTLAERWNGTSWSLMKTTNPGGSENDNGLWGVTCPSSGSCVAAGYTGFQHHQPLVERWTAPPIDLPLLSR
jgi:hypothetical protein